MPRLDPRNQDVRVHFGITEEYDPEDPGRMPTLDVCRPCYFRLTRMYPADDLGDVDHPLYEEAAAEGIVYRCKECRDELCEEDNWAY